jgi:hypothetical protein
MRNIVITTYLWDEKGSNNLLKRCIKSVEYQAGSVEMLTHVVVIDQCTGNDIRSCAEKSYERFIINRPERNGALANIIFGARNISIGSDDLISIIDGDDQLMKGALKSLNLLYKARPKALISSGGYVCESGAAPRFDIPWEGQDLRKTKWGASHLRSFKVKLYWKVPEEHFKRDDKYFMTCADLALMWPMIEIAGLDRYIHNKLPMYIYNDQNPQSDHRIHKDQQKTDEKYIRSMYPFKRKEKI